MGDEYRRFWITSSGADERERLLAEAFEAGAEGAEEQDEPARGLEAARFRACVYARTGEIERVRAVVIEAAGDGAIVGSAIVDGTIAVASSRGALIGPAEEMPAIDWSEEWKRGLGPIVISPRLVVRPPFAPAELLPGQHEIVIDPGQAFGTGTHASTRLCLEWLDALLADAAGRAHFARMLDVGTGSGVLALAAVALGSESAVGFDLDPIAIEAAEGAARENGLADRVRFLTVPIEAIDARPAFPLVVANLLKRELIPIAGEIARRVAPDGSLILAGLLEEDAAEVAAGFAAFQMEEVERRVREDSVGRWIAPRFVHRAYRSAQARASE